MKACVFLALLVVLAVADKPVPKFPDAFKITFDIKGHAAGKAVVATQELVEDMGHKRLGMFGTFA